MNTLKRVLPRVELCLMLYLKCRYKQLGIVVLGSSHAVDPRVHLNMKVHDLREVRLFQRELKKILKNFA